MDDLTKLMDMHPEMAVAVTIISVVSVYVCIKTVLWWLLYGTVGLIRQDYTFRKWMRYTTWGLIGMLVLVLVDAVLWFGFNPDNVVYTYSCWGLFVLASRVVWREFFTIGGLLRGDWSFSNPELCFFAWDTFNPFVIFKPIKWWLSSFGGLTDLFYVKSKETQELEDALWQQKYNQENRNN